MNVVLDTRIAGGTTGCRRTAREVRQLGHALGEAMTVCERQRGLPPTEFGGLAGAAFRIRVSALAATTQVGWERCNALAAGLDRLVDELTGCEEEMAMIRGRASGLLRVRGGSIHRPARTDGSGAEEAWITAVRAVAAVRRRESAAQREWEAVLARPWEPRPEPGDLGHVMWQTGAALGHDGPSHPPPRDLDHPTHPIHQTAGPLSHGDPVTHSQPHAGASSGQHSGVCAELVGPEYAAELCDPAPAELLGTAPIYYRADQPEAVTTGGS